MSTVTPPATPPKYSLKPGWICLGVSIASIVFFGPLGMIVGGPLIAICIILAVIGMAKNNTGGGIALLLSSFFLTPVAFGLWIIVLAFTADNQNEANGVDNPTTSLEPAAESEAAPNPHSDSGPADKGPDEID